MISSAKECAFIILNYRSAELSVACAQRVCALNPDYEVVVVDNASPDGSYEIIRSAAAENPHMHAVESKENNGYAAGNNVGLKYIEKHLPQIHYVVIMNPDVVIEKDAVVSAMRDTLDTHPDIAFVTARTIYNGEDISPNNCAWRLMGKREMLFDGTLLGRHHHAPLLYPTLVPDESGLVSVDVVQGCCFMGRLSLFSEIGFFDEHTFLYEEEAILAKKTRRLGYHNAVLANHTIQHNHKHKDKSLQTYRNRVWDARHLHNSRKYYIKKYSDASPIFRFFACLHRDIDFFFRRILYRLTMRGGK